MQFWVEAQGKGNERKGIPRSGYQVQNKGQNFRSARLGHTTATRAYSRALPR